MATELADQDTVGTALTLQMALGFSVTVVGIFSIPLVEVCMKNKRKILILIPSSVAAARRAAVAAGRTRSSWMSIMSCAYFALFRVHVVGVCVRSLHEYFVIWVNAMSW